MSTLPNQRKTPEELQKLRESIGIPAMPEPAPAAVEPPAPPAPVVAPEPEQVHRNPRPVRSLKRSERIAPAEPRHPTTAVGDGKIPAHRHTAIELQDLRRRDALAAMSKAGYHMPKAASAPFLLVAYLLAFGGTLAPIIFRIVGRIVDFHAGQSLSQGFHVQVAACAGALVLAAFIALTRKLSRHHAVFITLVCGFALVFSLLHYFPALRYGS